MTSVRVEALDPTDPRSQAAITEALLLFETSGYVQVDPWEESPPDLKAYQKQLMPVAVDTEP